MLLDTRIKNQNAYTKSNEQYNNLISLFAVKRLIIFDWDDVFTRGSIEGYYQCYHAALQGVGIELSYEEEMRRLRSKWGMTHEEELKGLLEEHPELVERAIKIYEENFFGGLFTEHISAVDGSHDLLDRLAGKYKLALSSGIHPKMLKSEVMPKLGIPDVFSHVITAYDLEDISLAKPNPFTAHHIMDKAGHGPDETLVVGDAKNDVLLAKNAKVDPVVVLSGHLSREEAEELGVRYIIEDVTKLEEVLNHQKICSRAI